MTDRPTLIGLVGGIASGKSTVARAFERRGARVIDADPLAKQLLDLPDVRRELAAAFGDVETGGRVDFVKLASAAFATAAGANQLNSIMHPRVSAEIARQVERWKLEGFRGAVIVDAPLLLEAGMKNTVDLVVFVDAPEEARRKRARERGWKDGEIERREGLQWPLDRKKAESGAVIANAGAVADVEKQVDELMNRIARGPDPARR
ncbi:MAG: dephospho-CoA kinase [Planctomycetes bacterium]|nr:dephospho-CoA kinase [Planctomycetota bacterium]